MDGGIGGLYPISLLIDEMKSEDAESRIAAMRKLRVIAGALGPERTRKELVPFLNEQVEDDDEVLLVMAEELGGFVDLVGGPGEAACLLGPLGALATVEETVVRDKAVESACGVIRGLPPAAVAEHVVPVITKLAQGDWFTAKVSACGLFASAYGRLGADAGAKTSLRQLYALLAADETPMVRRAAAKHIGGLAGVVEKEAVTGELLALFHGLANDDQDSVRLLAIENCTSFARVLSQPENQRDILPLVKACAGDKSWRVRNNVAKEFTALSEAMGAAVTRAELLPLYCRLLQDPEPEVRASASRNVAGYAGLVGPARFVGDILPCLRDAVADPATAVRAAVAEAIMDVPHAGSGLSREQTVSLVLPLVMACLRDDAPDVRLKVLEALGKVVGGNSSGGAAATAADDSSLLGRELVEGTVLPQLVALGSDPLWRVREKVIAALPLLATALGAPTFEDKLLPLTLTLLQDQVNAVRMAATGVLGRLAAPGCLGVSWMGGHVLPHLGELFRTPGGSYLQRITVLYALRELLLAAAAPAGGSAPGGDGAAGAPLAADATALLSGGLRDEVPNVRFVAAQIVAEVGGALGGPGRDALAAAVAELAGKDADADVRFFASRAVTAAAAGGKAPAAALA